MTASEGRTAIPALLKGGPMVHRFEKSLAAGVAAALVLSLVVSGLARAQEAALNDEQVKERLGYIESALKAGQPRAETWWYGWIGAYYTGALAGGILAASHWTDKKVEDGETVSDSEFAEGMLVGGSTFALGVGGLLLDPFVPAYAADRLAPMPETTAEERRTKLAEAEDLLRQCARREKGGRSWTTQMLNVGANAAGAVVTKAVFHQSWGSALITFATGEAVSLLNIFTQPMRATRDLRDYEAKYLGKGGAAMPAPAQPRWTLSAWPGGLTLSFEF
jgi:hypothetical protein